MDICIASILWLLWEMWAFMYKFSYEQVLFLLGTYSGVRRPHMWYGIFLFYLQNGRFTWWYRLCVERVFIWRQELWLQFQVFPTEEIHCFLSCRMQEFYQTISKILSKLKFFPEWSPKVSKIWKEIFPARF
jgi:hypothetical protein